jgi:phosphoserine phosphatase
MSAGGQPEEAGQTEDAGRPLERAEELVDETLHRLAGLAAKTAALAREEAEDIWAEAKELRNSHH